MLVRNQHSATTQGTADPSPAAVEDVGLDHGRLHAPVTEQFLDGANVIAVLKQSCRSEQLGLTTKVAI